jgi:hypothetical protein
MEPTPAGYWKILDLQDAEHNRIFAADDRALEDNAFLHFPYTDFRGRILYHSTRLNVQWTGAIVAAPAMVAYIEASRWSVKCECGATEYVTPRDPIGFCHACGNIAVNRAARLVVFPEDWQEIEQALCRRPVFLALRLSPIDRMRDYVVPDGSLPRDWQPGITLAQLEAENEEAGL